MATKRKTADQAQDNTSAEDEAAFSAAGPHTAVQATPTTPPAAQDNPADPREPGEDNSAEEPKKANWAPRTTIAVPLTEAAKRDHTKGEVARYIDGYNQGVGARIDSPDKDFRPSEEVKESLKVEHRYRESMRWNDKIVHNNKKTFHKKVSGKRPDGSDRSPVAERLDAEDRFEDMVLRRREEIEKASGDKTPF